ncbi:helix-turn-helix domain-containing protein [Hoeflea sp.]|uniref:helix-turn-helix domain-containing protein n=1 Tax=Hoeflea sp. TaxID=1940281 RepID=UPI0032628C6F
MGGKYRDFYVLAVHVHDLILRFGRTASKSVNLSPRELECLQWIAKGKTAWECAAILRMLQHTVRCYRESASKKLNASSNTHAVAIEYRAGLPILPL